MQNFNHLYEGGQLIFVGNSEKLDTRIGFNQRKAKLWAKNWVIDIDDPITATRWSKPILPYSS